MKSRLAQTNLNEWPPQFLGPYGYYSIEVQFLSSASSKRLVCKNLRTGIASFVS